MLREMRTSNIVEVFSFIHSLPLFVHPFHPSFHLFLRFWLSYFRLFFQSYFSPAFGFSTLETKKANFCPFLRQSEIGKIRVLWTFILPAPRTSPLHLAFPLKSPFSHLLTHKLDSLSLSQQTFPAGFGIFFPFSFFFNHTWGR